MRLEHRFTPSLGLPASFGIAILSGFLLLPSAIAQTLSSTGKPAAASAQPTHYRPVKLSKHAVAYYGAIWGIDALVVKAVESGELIRFSYQILDTDKAKPLNDKTNTPFLVAPDAGIRLSIPTLEKVGQLRQSSSPESGKSYWMAFSNPGRRVKPGDRVDVVIGQFRAEGLTVE